MAPANDETLDPRNDSSNDESNRRTRVVIIGGSIAGLLGALALKDADVEVVVVERNAEPLEISAASAFETWKRPGVPHFRHAHTFLGRLHKILREHYPDLLEELKEAGVETSSEEELSHWTRLGVPPNEDVVHLCARRPLFEHVLRKHVARLPQVRFLHASQVTGLHTSKSWYPALHSSAVVAEESLKAIHMLEISKASTRWTMLWHLCRSLLRSWFSPSKTPRLLPAPSRVALLDALGIADDAKPLANAANRKPPPEDAVASQGVEAQ